MRLQYNKCGQIREITIYFKFKILLYVESVADIFYNTIFILSLLV